MCDVPIFYATTHGQTRRIAEHFARCLRAQGFSSEAFDVSSPAAQAFRWNRALGAVLGASLHRGKHQPAACRFAKDHRNEIAAIPTLFFSVSLSAASLDGHEREAARRIAEDFVRAAAWSPWQVVCVPGRLAYTRYNLLTRWLMRRIAKKERAPTDTNRDHELTDWAAVERIARELAAQIRATSGQALSASAAVARI